jgi:hypothetical protein
MDFLRKVRPGEPLSLPAEAYNAFVDAALQARQGRVRPRDLKLEPSAQQQAALTIVCKNTSGAPCAKYQPVTLGDALFDPAEQGIGRPFQNELVVKCTPTEGSTPIQQWGVAAQVINPGQLGRVVIAGVTPARLNVVAAGGAEENARFCDAVPGQLYLRPTPGGIAPILWRETGIGLKWAYVHVGQRAGTVVRAGRVTAVTPTGAGPHPIEELVYSVQPNHLPTSGLLTNVTPWRPMGVPNTYKLLPAPVGSIAMIFYDHTAAGAEWGTPAMVVVPERLGVGEC